MHQRLSFFSDVRFARFVRYTSIFTFLVSDCKLTKLTIRYQNSVSDSRTSDVAESPSTTRKREERLERVFFLQETEITTETERYIVFVMFAVCGVCGELELKLE